MSIMFQNSLSVSHSIFNIHWRRDIKVFKNHDQSLNRKNNSWTSMVKVIDKRDFLTRFGLVYSLIGSYLAIIWNSYLSVPFTLYNQIYDSSPGLFSLVQVFPLKIFVYCTFYVSAVFGIFTIFFLHNLQTEWQYYYLKYDVFT